MEEKWKKLRRRRGYEGGRKGAGRFSGTVIVTKYRGWNRCYSTVKGVEVLIMGCNT